MCYKASYIPFMKAMVHAIDISVGGSSRKQKQLVTRNLFEKLCKYFIKARMMLLFYVVKEILWLRTREPCLQELSQRILIFLSYLVYGSYLLILFLCSWFWPRLVNGSYLLVRFLCSWYSTFYLWSSIVYLHIKCEMFTVQCLVMYWRGLLATIIGLWFGIIVQTVYFTLVKDRAERHDFWLWFLLFILLFFFPLF